MTNDEFPNDERITNDEAQIMKARFDIRHSFVIRASSFVILAKPRMSNP
jgi:hypothetical protein